MQLKNDIFQTLPVTYNIERKQAIVVSAAVNIYLMFSRAKHHGNPVY